MCRSGVKVLLSDMYVCALSNYVFIKVKKINKTKLRVMFRIMILSSVDLAVSRQVDGCPTGQTVIFC